MDNLTSLDELTIHEIEEEKKELKLMGFGYDSIDAGIVLTDEDEMTGEP